MSHLTRRRPPDNTDIRSKGMTTRAGTRFNRIHTVAIPVADQERALGFYRDTLGFEVRRDSTFGPGMRWVEVAPAGAETTVALPPPHGTATGVDTGIRLATGDARAAHTELAAAGVDVDEVLDLPGAPLMFFVRDVDGNTLSVVESS
jgi:lactoylglutathione lyase